MPTALREVFREGLCQFHTWPTLVGQQDQRCGCPFRRGTYGTHGASRDQKALLGARTAERQALASLKIAKFKRLLPASAVLERSLRPFVAVTLPPGGGNAEEQVPEGIWLRLHREEQGTASHLAADGRQLFEILDGTMESEKTHDQIEGAFNCRCLFVRIQPRNYQARLRSECQLQAFDAALVGIRRQILETLFRQEAQETTRQGSTAGAQFKNANRPFSRPFREEHLQRFHKRCQSSFTCRRCLTQLLKQRSRIGRGIRNGFLACKDVWQDFHQARGQGDLCQPLGMIYGQNLKQVTCGRVGAAADK